jgi:hypothetical protein
LIPQDHRLPSNRTLPKDTTKCLQWHQPTLAHNASKNELPSPLPPNTAATALSLATLWAPTGLMHALLTSPCHALPALRHKNCKLNDEKADIKSLLLNANAASANSRARRPSMEISLLCQIPTPLIHSLIPN